MTFQDETLTDAKFTKEIDGAEIKRSKSNEGLLMDSMLLENQLLHKEVYKLGEVSHERLEKPREFFAYQFFNSAKMMFFMQRKS